MNDAKKREAIARRLAVQLKHLERSWQGQVIGIGFDADLDTGRITLNIGPIGQTFNLTISADVSEVRVGGGEFN